MTVADQTPREQVVELLAKAAFDHERPDPVRTARQWHEADEFDRDAQIGAAEAQLDAISRAGLQIVPVEPDAAFLVSLMDGRDCPLCQYGGFWSANWKAVSPQLTAFWQRALSILALRFDEEQQADG